MNEKKKLARNYDVCFHFVYTAMSESLLKHK